MAKLPIPASIAKQSSTYVRRLTARSGSSAFPNWNTVERAYQDGWASGQDSFKKNQRYVWIIWIKTMGMYEYIGTEAETERYRGQLANEWRCIVKKFSLGFSASADDKSGPRGGW